MDKFLSKSIDKLLEDISIEALYIYGSYVNGYYRKDSDIDVVALTQQNPKNKPLEMPPNISVHLIHPFTLSLYELGHPYAHLRMMPIHNKEKCMEISDKLKSELVRRQLIRFKKAGIKEFNVLEPFNSYLLNYGIQRPWRIKPIKRIFESNESQKILEKEYERIFKLLEQKGMVEKNNGKYKINPDFIFDEEFEQEKDGFLFKVKNSYFGWYYLRNVVSMIEFARGRV